MIRSYVKLSVKVTRSGRGGGKLGGLASNPTRGSALREEGCHNYNKIEGRCLAPV